MKLHDVINNLFIKYRDKAISNMGDDKLYYESMGRMRMCNELMKVLTMDSLLMDVEVNTHAVLRGD